MKLVVIKTDNIPKEEAEAAEKLLPAQRRAEILRFQNPVRRFQSLAGELCVRLKIVQTLRVPNENIRILRGENEKPRLENCPDFHFNISHSGDVVACAFDEFPVGVDIERVKEAEHAAARCFSPQERAELAKSSDPALFFRLWTAMESEIKRRGGTLAGGLRGLGERDADKGDITAFGVSFSPDRFLPNGEAGEYVLSVSRDRRAKTQIDKSFLSAEELLQAFLAATK